jgi:hypothetical protein
LFCGDSILPEDLLWVFLYSVVQFDFTIYPGKTYTVSGKLYDQTDDKILDDVSGQKTFTPTAADGSVDVDFGTLELTAGHTYVVFEYLYEGETASGEAVASHEDKNDTAQTFVVQEKSEIEKISIPVKKEWSDDKNKTAVQFELLRNDEVVRTITLDANNNWSGSFDDLDKTDANGVAYTYTVREVGRWVNVRTTDTSGKVTIKNLFLPNAGGKETTSLTVYKKWAAGLKEEAVTVQLLQNGKEVTGGIVTLSAENNWFCTFENLPKYDENDEEYQYSVEEIGGKWKYTLTKNPDGSITITNEVETTTPSGDKGGESNRISPTKTGDASHIAGYILLAGAAAAGVLILAARKRRSSRR